MPAWMDKHGPFALTSQPGSVAVAGVLTLLAILATFASFSRLKCTKQA